MRKIIVLDQLIKGGSTANFTKSCMVVFALKRPKETSITANRAATVL